MEARLEKARRGELIVASPAGYVKNEDQRLEKDPDRRVEEGISLVFAKFLDLGSARQTLLWFLECGLQIPVSAPRGRVVWRRPRYTTIYSILSNTVYAGRMHTEKRNTRRITITDNSGAEAGALPW